MLFVIIINVTGCDNRHETPRWDKMGTGAESDSVRTNHSQNTFPWIICAGFTTFAVYVCYVLTRNSESKGFNRTNRPVDSETQPPTNSDSTDPPAKLDDDNKHVLDVITVIICFFSIFAVWRTKNDNEPNSKDNNK